MVVAFLLALGFKPNDTTFSFGIGHYAAASLAVVCFIILRDPIWRGRGSSLT